MRRGGAGTQEVSGRICSLSFMMVWSWLLEWWEAGWVQASYRSLLQLLVAESGNQTRAAWGDEMIEPGAALAKGDLAVTELSILSLRDHLLSLDCPWDLGDTGSECAEQYEDSQGLPEDWGLS